MLEINFLGGGKMQSKRESNELKKESSIQSLQIGFTIIDLVANYGQPVTLAEIYEKIEISKSNLYKYLNTLTFLNVLYKDDDGKYTLGSRIIDYVLTAVDQENIIERLIPSMQEINRYCGESVSLQVWTHNGPMVIHIVNSNRMTNLSAQIGSYMPIQSATGKVFASFIHDAQVGDWKTKEFQRFSQKQIDELEKEFLLISKNYISFAKEPVCRYVSSISIPVLNYHHQLVASITIVGFQENIPQDMEHPLSQTLLKKGKEISAMFGCRI